MGATALVAARPAAAAVVNAHWGSATTGNWSTAARWTSNPNVPNNGAPAGTTYTVALDAAGTAHVVTLDASRAVTSLTLNSAAVTLNHTTGTLAVPTVTLTAGKYNLAGGTLSAATVGGAASLVGLGGTLAGVTLNAPLNLFSVNGASANVTGGLTLNGTATLGTAAGTTYGYLNFTGGPQALAGTGTVLFGGSGNNGVVNGASAATLTINAGVTLHGHAGAVDNSYSDAAILNQGTIAADVAAVSPGYLTVASNGDFTNQGTVSASAGNTVLVGGGGTVTNTGTMAASAGGTLDVRGNWTNTGTLSVNNATLNLGGTFTAAAVGTIARTGGVVNVDGTLDNTGNTLALSGAGTGTWNLASSGTIRGGTLAPAGEADFVPQGGQLDGVTVTNSIAVSGAQYLRVANGLTLNGTAGIGDAAGSTYGQVYFQGAGAAPQSLAGAGTVVFGDNGNNAVYNQTSGTLTIASTVQVRGSRGTISNLAADGTLVNQGTVSADVAGGEISFGGGGTVVNQGTLSALDGGSLLLGGAWSNAGTVTVDATSTLRLGGTFAAADVGTVNRAAGSTVVLTGTLENTGNTLAFTPATGSWRLAGRITGGSVDTTAADGLIADSGRLDDVTVNGPLDAASRPYATLYVENGLVLNGNAAVGAPDGTSYNSVLFVGPTGQSELLDGSAVVTFGANANNAVLNYLPGGTLTLAAGVTVSGHSGTIGNAYGDATLINQGTVASGTAGGDIHFGANGTVVNAGTLSATGGGTLSIAGAWSNTGTISLAAGSTLNLGGTFETADVGIINRTGGTVNLTGELNNAGHTLALTTVTGAWQLVGTVTGGNVTAAGGGKLVAADGRLDGVTYAGALDVSSTPYASVHVVNGLTLNGSATVGAADGSSYSGIYFDNLAGASQTLGGTADIAFGASANNTVYNAVPAATLTIGSGVKIHGHSGSVYAAYQDGVVVNQGTIAADAAGGNIAVNQTYGTVVGFRNQGTVTASAGGTLTLNGNWANTGTLSAGAGGTLVLAGTVPTAAIGTLQNTGGAVRLAGVIENAGATLALASASGSWALAGQITGGTVNSTAASGGLAFEGGTLAGVTLVGPTSVINQSLDVTGGLVNNGVLTVGSPTSGYGAVYFGGAAGAPQTLGGTGSVVFGTSGSNLLYNTTPGGTLTIGSGFTVRGHSGGIQNAYGGGAVVNLGTIVADGNGGTINLTPGGTGFTNSGTLKATAGGTLSVGGTWSNSGPLLADGGTLVLGGDWTHTGTVSARNGGGVRFTGVLNNTARTLTLAAGPGASSWTLAGTITGGTVNAAAAAGGLVAESGRLTGVTLAGTAATGVYSVLRVDGGLTLGTAGHVVAGAADGTDYGQVHFDGPAGSSQTLGGTGDVLLGANSSNAVYNYVQGGTLTIGPGVTIHGHTGYVSSAYGDGPVVNNGTVSADGDGGTIYVSGGGAGLANHGTLSASAGGTLSVNGTWTNTGSIAPASGGTVVLAAAGTNSAAVVVANGATLRVQAPVANAGHAITVNTGGTARFTSAITGGSINAAAPGGLVSDGGTLDGVTLGGTLAIAPGAALFVNDGITVNGAAAVGTADGTGAGSVFFTGPAASPQTLAGTGTMVLGLNDNNAILNYTPAGTLTIAATATIRGRSGYVYNVYSDGALINKGTVTSDMAGGTVHLADVGGGTFANQGTLSAASGGTLIVGGTWANAGSLAPAAGGTVQTTGTWNNVGGIAPATDGTLLLGGTYTTAGFSTSAGTAVIGGSPTWTASPAVTAGGGAKIVFAVDVGTAPGGTTMAATANGTIEFEVSQHLRSLTVGPNGVAKASASVNGLDLFTKTVSVDGGPTSPTGKIDLKAGNLVVTYGTGGSTRPNVEQLVAFGALNANSAGIVTSAGTPGGLTLGVADTADVGGITLYNSSATIPANSVVVRYTYAGDATLDGSVDTADLGVMLDNFGALADPGGRQWSIGDVNYDASVDTADLGLALDNFGQLAGSGAVQAALAGLGFTLADGVETGVANGQSIRLALTGAALPEPASLGLLGVGAMTLLGRRRRRRA